MEQQRPTWYYRAITEGVIGTGMGRWDHRLDEGTRWDTAFYVWSLVIPPEAYRRGGELYDMACRTCHGADGRSEPQAVLDAAELAQWSRAERAQQLQAVHPDLVPFRATDLATLVAYLGTFLYEPSDR